MAAASTSVDAKTAWLNGLIPPMLSALKQFKSGGSNFFAGTASDGPGQRFEIYCTPGRVNCMNEEVEAAGVSAATLPFFDFGYIRWPDAARSSGITVVSPALPQDAETHIYFVHPFASLLKPLQGHEFAHAFGDLWGGNWIFPAFEALRAAGHKVHLSTYVVPGQINVLMNYNSAYLGPPEKLAKRCSAAVVACADTDSARGLLDVGCHVICQNELQHRPPESDPSLDRPAEARAHTLPMFPQQSLRRREATRGAAIRRLVFMGDRHQLDPALTSADFLRALDALSITFDVVDKSRIPEWGDYSEADLVLAIRPPGCAVELKPPSKLINAWRAGVPALLGREPAYQRLRHAAHDYVEVACPSEALEAIRRLIRHPEDYLAMLERCRERAREFSPERIAEQWAEVLFGRVASAAAGAAEADGHLGRCSRSSDAVAPAPSLPLPARATPSSQMRSPVPLSPAPPGACDATCASHNEGGSPSVDLEVSAEQLLEILASSGRVSLLAQLQQMGVSPVGERQRIANELGRRLRAEGRATKG